MVETATTESTVAMAARLHDLAMIVGERLNIASVEILEAVARGNTKVYDAEVTRLATRYVDQLADTWES